MQVNVNVDGIVFEIPVGEGEQNFKWLGLAASQRYALMVPHGRTRTREDAHRKHGVYVPSSVVLLKGKRAMMPFEKIKDHCKMDDHLTVDLRQEMEVDEIGNPVLTKWMEDAFYEGGCRKQEVKRNSVWKQNGEVEELVENNDEGNQIQAAMIGQMSTVEEIDVALTFDWKHIVIEDVEPDVHEQECIRDVLLDNYLVLNSSFLHYGIGMSSAEFRMSLLEFNHFVHETGLFHGDKDQKMIEKIFKKCVKDDGDKRISKPGFLQACFRISIAQAKLMDDTDDPTSIIFDTAIQKFIKPTALRLTTNEIRDITHSDVITSLFEERKVQLGRIFTDQQKPDSFAVESDTIPASRLSELILSSGVMCHGTLLENTTTIQKVIVDTYKGFTIDQKDERYLVFAEYIETISAIAIQCWDTNDDVSPRDVISIVFDALYTANVAIPHKK